MPRRLPPLNAIRAFETSARHGGFVPAAQELGVTPAAISLQIRKLEDFYEVALFHRLASGVELTEVGAAIFADCTPALATLELTGDLVAAREARSRRVLSCINSLAHRWLARHLSEVAVRVPDHWIELRAEPDPVDFEDLGVDIRITYGKHLYPHHDTRPLFSDTWRREMTMLPPSYIPRWIDVQVHGEDTPRKAFAFTANPESPNYAGELTPDEVAACLSEACGHWGSGAEYLLQTVTSLEAAGFHDPYL